MIRYNKSTNNEIARVVRNYNSKIVRLQKSNNKLILPEKASVKEIKKTVGSRRELNRKLNELKLYSKRGIEETIRTNNDLKISKYEKRIFNRRLGIAKAMVTKEIKNYESKYSTFGDIGKAWANPDYQLLVGKMKSLRETSIGNMSKREQLETKLKVLGTVGKYGDHFSNEVLRQNFLDKLEYTALIYNNDKDKILRIKQKINSLSDEEFYRLFKDDYSQLSDVMNFSFSPKELKSRGANAIKEVDSLKDKNEDLINYLDENLDRFIKNIK